MPIDCWSCHQADFAGTTQPNHASGQFDHDCTACHSMQAWKPASFDHAKTQFPLTGKHAAAFCEKCHVNGQYKNMQRACFACHQQDFNRVAQPNHVAGQFDHDCTPCHSTNGWKPSVFDHAATQFPLTGKHSAAACEKCHVNGQYKNMQRDCYACHQADFSGAVQPGHTQNQFPHDCLQCHATTGWKPSSFNHDATRFPLAGAHRAKECSACHVNGRYSNMQIDCWSCHQQEYQSVVTPNHVTGLFNRDCSICHAASAWKPSQLDHGRTRFPLSGRHLPLKCEQCHINGQYGQTLSFDCYSCHQGTYVQAKSPDHAAGQFDHDCSKCHATTGWKPSTFDHASTKFALTGAHVTRLCQDCHINGNYALSYIDCYQCHDKKFSSAVSPNHVSGQFSHTCTDCHGAIAWKPSLFNHGTTKLPLTGRHAMAACERCHVGGNYALQYTDCYQCHQQDYTGAVLPNHVAAKFSHDCASCHSTNTWKPASFDHATTKFPLSGMHAAATCDKCHINGNYNLAYSDCFGCHQDKFNSVQQPSHTAGKFDHDCTKCHSASGWKPVTFDHATTKFPLSGAHVGAACDKCHVGGNYTLAFTDCYQCHQSKFASVTQPNHVTGKFDHDCTKCHSTAAWKPASFNHASTNFPLTGSHAATTCDKCHTNGNYGLVYSDCWQCHQSKYTQAQNPNHVSGQIPHDCTQCHSTSAWKPASFNHATTNFALTGKHTSTACDKCHVGGNYQLAYTDCYACHRPQFDASANPGHLAGQFPHDCTACHSTNGWRPSTFDHATTKFPLQGRHTTVPCQNCHVNGNYTLAYTDCWQCHQSNFNAVQTPSHASNQFPHDCLQCHTVNGWKPSTFSHATTAFPLQGGHAAVPCANCHANGNYHLTYTDCWQCHQPTYTNTANPAHATNQFPHDCTACHTQSTWKPSTFSHSATAFPLQGAHATKPCNSCHVNGNYNLTYTDCWQCHQSTYTNTANPAHATNQFPHDCTLCHAQTSWVPSTFNHSSTAFPLQGAHTTRPCNDCHVNGNYSLHYTDCYQCHQSDFNGVTNPNHVSNQFSHICTTCHTQTAWLPSTFNHSTTNFPLQGAHVSQACSKCHINGNYQLVYTDCYQCHQTKFSSATTPANHTALSLSHNCATCHNQTSWSPASIFRTSHSQNYPSAFPIYTGSRHAYPSRWSNCNQCHTANNTHAFCCTAACHTNQSSLAGDHSGVSGYTYSCTSCVTCHPDGRAP
jgi:hypothetical protein